MAPGAYSLARVSADLCHSSSCLASGRLGSGGTSKVACQGVRLVIWIAVTWHVGNAYKGFGRYTELTPQPRGDLVPIVNCGLLESTHI